MPVITRSLDCAPALPPHAPAPASTKSARSELSIKPRPFLEKGTIRFCTCVCRQVGSGTSRRIKNYGARIAVVVSDSRGSYRPHSIGPAPEARHFHPKEAVTKTGPHERVTAILIDNDNNTYYRHATYPPEKQGLRAGLVFNPHYDGLTKQDGQKHFEEAIKNVENKAAKHRHDWRRNRLFTNKGEFLQLD